VGTGDPDLERRSDRAFRDLSALCGDEGGARESDGEPCEGSESYGRIIHTEGVETFYRGVGAQYGWGEKWEEIEQQALHTFLDNPVGRFGTVDEVADTVVFLASPRAAYINGADIRVDGGAAGSIN
jgi:NAD(P)-dependent dehydrogenase (short-subunit alcohol dehydrogenase family)